MLYIWVKCILFFIGIFVELIGRVNIDVGVSVCVNLFDFYVIINLIEFKCVNCKICLFFR